MCGIAGLIGDHKYNQEKLKFFNNILLKSIAHRGPDYSGSFVEENFSLSLVHTRLSIRDLSNAGNQPMISPSGRYVLIFNGEIYNSDEIKNNSQLNKYPFKGDSDTEVLLASIDVFGIDQTLLNIDGMYAFALYDRDDFSLSIFRDKFGEKPLYWGNVKDQYFSGFLFSSDISSFTKVSKNLKIDKYSKRQFYEYGCIIAPNTIFQNIFQLEPGNKLKIKFKEGFNSLSNKYHISNWNKLITEFNNDENKKKLSKESKSKLLFSNLKKSVSQRLISDVPLCTFLSSGIDSSLITSIASSYTKDKLSTFTVKFTDNINSDKNFDESRAARKIAEYLKTNHTEFQISPAELVKAVDQMSNIYTEPFSDSSQIPTFLLCQKVRENGFKVALTGDGGDELFAGYNRHIFIPKIINNISIMPEKVRNNLKNFILFFKSVSSSFYEDKLQKLYLSIENSSNLYDLYKSLRSVSFDIQSQTDISKLALSYLNNESNNSSILRRILIADLVCYLPNDVLTKVDRASMSVGLECRAPFLSNEVFQTSLLFDNKELISKGLGKMPLRNLLSEYIPHKYITKFKRGFSIPLADWLRGPLKIWAEEILSNIGEHSLVEEKVIESLWIDHLNKYCDNSKRLWTILMWENWSKKYKNYFEN